MKLSKKSQLEPLRPPLLLVSSLQLLPLRHVVGVILDVGESLSPSTISLVENDVAMNRHVITVAQKVVTPLHRPT